MTASVPSADEGQDPAASLAALDAAQHHATRALRPSPLAMFLPWGLGYLVAFGAVWLAVPPHAVIPGWLVAVLVVASLVGALASTAVAVTRSGRGVSGRTRRISALYGWAWLAGFAAIVLVDLRLGALGVPAGAMSLVWSSSALLVVGLLYLAGGMLFDAAQYALGVWTLACAVAVVLVGYPANFLVLALAGGGGFVALGVVTHLRARPARA